MQKLNLVFYVALICLLTNPLVGQNEVPKEEEKKPIKNLGMAVEMTSTIMTRMFEKAGLDEEQRQQIKDILDTNVKDLVYSRQELQEFFTAEQQKTYNAAIKLARNAKFDSEKAHGYALRKLKLSEDRLAAYNAIKTKADGVFTKINYSISAILSDEQKAKVPSLLQPKKDAADKDKASAEGSGEKTTAEGSDDKGSSEGSNDKRSNNGSGRKGSGGNKN